MTVPTVADPFYWTQETWGAALRCRALDPVARHVFTTRQLALPHPDAWAALAATLAVAPDSLRRVRQVHGNTVVVADHPGSISTGTNEGDALVAADPSLALAVVAADCVPVLLADRKRGVVGAVHAGWRGTVARVAPAAVEAMGREYGTSAADLVVAIGPCIGACCYEVGSDVVDAFAAAGHPRHLVDRWVMADLSHHGNDGRPALRLDLAGAIRDQLALCGVAEARIHGAGICTAMHLELLTSYRVEGQSAMRIAAAIRRAS